MRRKHKIPSPCQLFLVFVIVLNPEEWVGTQILDSPSPSPRQKQKKVSYLSQPLDVLLDRR